MKVLPVESPFPFLAPVLLEQPHPLLFVTVSGAHLYGFPSVDSDYDLRGVHVLPAKDVVGLNEGRQTIEISEKRSDLELDLVTHDVRKFIDLMLRRNGYVLEQLLSPLVLHSTEEHLELKEISKSCVTRHHSHHYLGFAQNQWKLFEKERPRRIKPLLYVYRVLLTGIHLMQTGEVEANLLVLNEEVRLPFLAELVQKKVLGEQSTLDEPEMDFHAGVFETLISRLETASEKSALPEAPSGRAALHDLLVRLRLG